MKNKLKKAAVAGAAAAGAFTLIGEVVYSAFLTRKGTELVNKLLPPVDEDSDKIFKSLEKKPGINDWYEKAQKKEIFTVTREGRKCRAYYVENPVKSHRYVICCHGYTSKPADMGPYGAHFAEMGYNVLFPSLIAHGAETSKNITMGWYDRLIVVAFAYYIAEKDPEAQILLHGVSMGGATVMMATGERMPANVKCCVEDCGYTSAYDVFAVQIRNYLGLSVFPFIPAADMICRLRAKYSFKQCSALEQVKKSVTPTLFIHGDRDTFVPFWMLQPLYDNAACEKEKLVIGEAVHAVSAFVDPETYWSRVKEFTEKYIK